MANQMAIELYVKNIEAQKKVSRNASKLAWMDATRYQADAVLRYQADLERYVIEAKKAAQDFADYCEGMPVSEIVEIINEATRG